MQTNIPKCAPETLVFLGMEYKKNKKERHIPIEEILHEVCLIFKQPEDKVKSMDRSQQYVNCRNIFAYVCSLATNCTLKEIGECLGHRDHTTIIHGKNKVKGFLEIKDSRFMINWELYTSNSSIWREYMSKQ